MGKSSVRIDLALALVALLCAAVSLGLGPAHLGWGRAFAALTGQGDAIAGTIVWELRLPRALLALMVGAMLGAAGAALQGYLRNPLADPGVLGTSSTAALGAVVALYYGFAAVSPLMLPLFAIIGALAGLVPLLLLAARSEGPLALILAGVAIATAAGAGISLALNLAPNPFAAIEIMTWLMGSLADRSFLHVWLALPCIAIGLGLILLEGRALDALTLGEDGAIALGVNLPRTRARLLIATAIGVGGAVAVSGAIGFVGLVVPHLLRPFTDRRPSSLLIPSALGGAALLAAADALVRTVPTLEEPRLGVVTALIGVPIFLHQLVRARREW
ncbi:FecCD family ABC transporter permease [Sphingomonas crusticola]|uniref:FecCD family ABC transporter permease n=1 Tax=Sphingomonas crusticola TaxID=1697973 RepID=UPI000E25B4F4|nr:iron ABC transporter permease [Sphingomonas crusticola]